MIQTMPPDGDCFFHALHSSLKAKGMIDISFTPKNIRGWIFTPKHLKQFVKKYVQTTPRQAIGLLISDCSTSEKSLISDALQGIQTACMYSFFCKIMCTYINDAPLVWISGGMIPLCQFVLKRHLSIKLVIQRSLTDFRPRPSEVILLYSGNHYDLVV